MNAHAAIRPKGQTQPLELTILMPCLNEAETIATCVDKAMAYLERAGVSGEVLIADNGSTDGSQDIAKRHGARVVAVPSKGYGAALLGGIDAAQGRYIVMGDADDSYDFSALGPFLDKLRGGADLVMGNRFEGGIEPNAMPFLHRYLGNPVLSFLGRLFFKVPTGDFHCGLRGFNAESIRALTLKTTGMEFASEMVVRSALAGLKIEEVPTTLKPDGRSRPPHLKTWRDGWRHLKFLLMYNPRWLFFIPGLTLCALGLSLVVLLFVGPLQLNSTMELDLNTFFTACVMMVTGTQLLSFGILSRYYAHITGILPNNQSSDWLSRSISTDRLALNGGICFLAGVLFFAYACTRWAQIDFGPLTNSELPRIIVLGLTLIVIGLQAFFSAFLLGVLEIPVKTRQAVEPTTVARAAAPSLIDQRLLRFIVVGGGAALLLFVLSYVFVKSGLSPFIGSTLAYSVAFVCAYLAQRGWTFGGEHAHTHAFPRYLATQLGCALLGGCVAHVAVHVFGATPFVMSALSTIIASAVSYVLSKNWVFADKDRQ